MDRRLITVTALVLSVAALAAAATTRAGGYGYWTKVTSGNGRNIDQVGLARTGDGTLHIAYPQESGSSKTVQHTSVRGPGEAKPPNLILGDLRGVDNPALVVLPDGRLAAFFSALGDTPDEGGVAAAIAPASGKGWKRQGVRVSSTTTSVGPVAATLAADGAPVIAYARSFALGVHVGLDPATPDLEVQPNGQCCDYVPGLATDAKSGETMIAWYSNAKGRTGTWVRRVLPSLGKPQLAPGSVTGGNAISTDQTVAVSARSGAPGVYLAYCTGYPVCSKVVLWRVGGKALAAGGSDDVEDVAISNAPDGRLWVMWHDGRSNKVYVTRTNKAATKVGTPIELQPPKGTSSMWKLSGEGSPGILDVLASVTSGTSLATWHTMVRPRLTVAVKKTVPANQAAIPTVTFTVTDVGDPVAGAKITYAGAKKTSDAGGKATFTLVKGSQKLVVLDEPYELVLTDVAG